MKKILESARLLWSLLPVVIGIFLAANALAQTGVNSVVSEELVLKAQREGSVRVIVHIKEAFKPEGELKNFDAVAAQRKGITNAQDRVFKELSNIRHKVFRRFETIPFVAIEAGVQALAILERSGLVAHVEEDSLFAPMLSQSVPVVEGNQAWAEGFDGDGWAVAVLDTGVDKNHPFLTGKVVSEACFSGNGNCPNGLITQIGSGAGISCTYAALGCQHGTHVAGITAGKGSLFSGVAKEADLISIQVFSLFTGVYCLNAGEDPCALAYVSDWLAGLEHVFMLRNTFQIAAVNMSLGGNAFTSQAQCDAVNPSVKAAIDNLRSVGIATVAASGNNGYLDKISLPGCISSAVSVGSTTKTDGISTFSNSASFLSLLAPGSSIYSSVPGGGFTFKNGTSMAAPHVAGAWAILKQKAPQATVDQVLKAFQSTGLPIRDINNVTTARIRIAQALNFFETPLKASVFGVFRQKTGKWYIDLDGNGIWSGCGPDGCWGVFGSKADIPVAGDWTNTGTAKVGVFRPSTGMWYLDNGNGAWDSCGTDICRGPFGGSKDIPVAGDWTNTGTSKIGVFRMSTGMWYLDNGNGTWDGCGTDICRGPFGGSKDIPVAGDWTNTGTAKIGVFRMSTGMWYLDSGNGIWNDCETDICTGLFGSFGDLPVAGSF